MNNDLGPKSECLQQLSSIEPRHCYNELCKIHSKFVFYYLFVLVKFCFLNSIPLITTNPIVFNDTLLSTSRLSNLESNKIIVDDSTINNLTVNVLRQKYESEKSPIIFY
jgi:hypothetical protein